MNVVGRALDKRHASGVPASIGAPTLLVAATDREGDRSAIVDAFLLQCNRESPAGFKVIRKHIWQAAGHVHPRQFQYWQKESDKATDEDDRNFSRILHMTPTQFIALLDKKGISPLKS
jgi:hypothetical protein